MALLRIELLDDCDMNSGRVVNTYFADDVFFDGFGMPYIPAWVIRNTLARSLEDMQTGLASEDAEALVGMHANLVLDDALVADRESMRQAILSNKYGGMLLRNPQAVLNAAGFVKVKPASSANKYVRVLARGTIFEAHYELDESYCAAFRRLIEHTHDLFVGHTTRARFTIDETWQRPQFVPAEPAVDFDGEQCRLEYDLHIISHTTQRDHISGELDAKPYISGRDVRDALAVRAELSEMLAPGRSSVRCSYAYIAAGGHRGFPIPASYSTKKQDKSDLRDRCSLGRRPDDYDQIKGMGTLFIDDPDASDVCAVSVRKEQAIAQYYEFGSFTNFRFCAIGGGQTCKGFIEGPAKDVKRIYESLMADGYVRVGHLSNVGFGNAYIQVRNVAPVRTCEPVLAEEITVLLVSPARLYRNGLYEASAQRVLEEVQSLIGDAVELEIVRNSQKTCCITTYNKVWKELEPIEYAMQAGSIYRMRAKDGRAFDVSRAMGGAFIGGHNDVGYGETWIFPAVDKYYRTISYGSLSDGDFPLSYQVDPNPGRRLMRRLYQRNANALASYMGAAAASDYVRNEFCQGPLKEIQSTIGDDFDLEEAFVTYLDSLKDAGLNAIRRGIRG